MSDYQPTSTTDAMVWHGIPKDKQEAILRYLRLHPEMIPAEHPTKYEEVDGVRIVDRRSAK